MSRIGNKPISIPSGVDVKIEKNLVIVKGPKGELDQKIASEDIVFDLSDENLTITRKNELIETKSMHGLYRALIANMVTGVTEGFSKKLELIGTGYRAQLKGKSLELSLGFSHSITVDPIGENKFSVEDQTILQIDPLSITEQELVEAIASLDFETPVDWRGLGKDDWLDLLLTEFVQPRLGLERPCILYNYPASQSALARLHPEDERVAERFELFVQGIELANGYHELLDAGELQKRNLKTNALRQLDDRPLLPSDSYLLSAMRHGLPDCCGIALGFDRLAMLALGKSSIDQVIPFPFDRA